jgi:hypothetical protein
VNTRSISKNNSLYIECLPDGLMFDSEDQALDLVAACIEGKTPNLLIHSSILPLEFYDLRTGLAGTVLQKFSNYHIRAAVLLSPEQSVQGRFQEMVLEANRGNQFRVFRSRELAENWLTGAFGA